MRDVFIGLGAVVTVIVTLLLLTIAGLILNMLSVQNGDTVGAIALCGSGVLVFLLVGFFCRDEVKRIDQDGRPLHMATQILADMDKQEAKAGRLNKVADQTSRNMTELRKAQGNAWKAQAELEKTKAKIDREMGKAQEKNHGIV